MRPVLAICILAACTPRAYTPPSRFAALDSPVGPTTSGTDLQLDASRIGSVFGPDLVDGGARLRHAVTDRVVVEGETGVARVLNDGQGGARNAYTGRAGIMLRIPNPDSFHAALSMGLGGGWSPVAASWGSIDVGASVAGSHRAIRPLLAADLSYNQPFGDHPFVVTEPDGDATTLHLTRNLTARATVGVELGPPRTTLILGLSLLRVFAATGGEVAPQPTSSSHDDGMFVAVGVGFRAALD